MKKTFLFLPVLFFLASCAATGPRYEAGMIRPPSKSRAQAVFYFPFDMNGIRSMSLKVENKLCSLYANGFIIVPAKPGKISVDLNGDTEEIPLEAGETTYIKIYLNPAKQRAANFGLVGMLAYAAVKHGTRENADVYFDVVEEELAVEEIAGEKMHKSPGCRKE